MRWQAPRMPDRRHPPAAPHLVDSFAAGVYGSIVAAALVGALREEGASATASVLSLMSTMGVFWLAHVWSQITGERIHHGRRFKRELVVELARAEWPLVEATFGPALILLFGSLGLVSDRAALTGALAICGVQLLAWGFVVGRRAYDQWYYAVLSALSNGVLGVVLVSLETIVLH
jgi:hypothetical protein